jgi:hypothetical protein
MANTAFLKIDGKESPLHYLSYEFHRHIEDNGKPATRIRRGTISMTKDSILDKGSFTNWMADPDKQKDGEITIYTDEKKEKKLKVIKFQHGYVIDYRETFDLEKAANNTLESFTISAEIIEVDSAKFDFKWPESY